ncbi:MAG: hypothetical protein RLZZ31_1106 [Actinomycetota bacterium]
MRNGRMILRDVNWNVEHHSKWVVLGRNGSGKSSLIRIASLYLHPSSGEVEVDGELLGRTDVRQLRKKIGIASAAMLDQLRGDLLAADVVMTAKNAALEPWWHNYDDHDRQKAVHCLEQMGIGHLAGRSLSTLSSGERQRVVLARTLMTDPVLVLLDEPTAGLDLAGREELLHTLEHFGGATGPAVVLVTHHVEEIPANFSSLMLLRAGEVQQSGRLDEVLTAESLSSCFGLDVQLEHRHGRYWAWSDSTRSSS